MSRRGRTRPKDGPCPECNAPRGSACKPTGVRTEEGHHLPRVEQANARAEWKKKGLHW